MSDNILALDDDSRGQRVTIFDQTINTVTLPDPNVSWGVWIENGTRHEIAVVVQDSVGTIEGAGIFNLPPRRTVLCVVDQSGINYRASIR